MKEKSENPFEPTDYTRFQSTEEVIKNSVAETMIKTGFPNGTFGHMQYADEIDTILSVNGTHINRGSNHVIEHLKRHGFRRLSGQINNGAYAIVMEGNNHQIIRLVYTALEAPRIENYLAVQPIVTIFIEDYRIEVLPKVHTFKELVEDPSGKFAHYYGNNTSEFYQELDGARHKFFNDARACGLTIYDAKKKENLAVMRGLDGKPVVFALDAGVLRPASHMQISPQKQKIHDYYKSVQEAHLKSLGLTKGELKGVLNDEQLDQALSTFISQRHKFKNPVEAMYPSALKAGVSPGEFGAAATRAAESNASGGFCERIRGQLNYLPLNGAASTQL